MASLARSYFIASVLAALLIIAYYLHYTAHLVGPPSGRTPEGLLLGILGFAAMVGALLYSARRRLLALAMRPIIVDPEARKELKDRERRAMEQLQKLQRQVQQNPRMKSAEVRRQAKQILKDTGMKRYVRARVITGAGGKGTRLSIERREWAGRLQIWYYWHLMLGCLSILLIATHAGFRFGNLIALSAFLCLVGVVATSKRGFQLSRFLHHLSQLLRSTGAGKLCAVAYAGIS